MVPAPFPALQEWFYKRYGHLIMFYQSELADADPAVMDSINFEICRQTSAINLIASESLPSPAVMAASGTLAYVQTVEGRIGHRWYPFVAGIDTLESITEARAKSLFGFAEANVQPHSATQANQAVYLSVLKPGETILSMAFTSGGHLSHGFGSSLASRLYKIETFGVPTFEEGLDVAELERQIQQVRPSLIVAGCSAYPKEIPFEAISQLAKRYGAHHLADISHTAGFVAAGIHSAVSSADFSTLSLHKTMCGPRGGIVFSQLEYRQRLDKAVFPGLQGAIFPNLMAAKAACLRDAETEPFRRLQTNIIRNARAMAEVFLDENIALFTGGTDTHLLLIRKDPAVDSRSDVEKLLKTGVLTNANLVHGDPLGANRMSGIRMGTTWITQLGFKTSHARMLAAIIAETLKSKLDRSEILRRRIDRLLCDVVATTPELSPS